MFKINIIIFYVQKKKSSPSKINRRNLNICTVEQKTPLTSSKLLITRAEQDYAWALARPSSSIACIIIYCAHDPRPYVIAQFFPISKQNQANRVDLHGLRGGWLQRLPGAEARQGRSFWSPPAPALGQSLRQPVRRLPHWHWDRRGKAQVGRLRLSSLAEDPPLLQEANGADRTGDRVLAKSSHGQQWLALPLVESLHRLVC